MNSSNIPNALEYIDSYKKPEHEPIENPVSESEEYGEYFTKECDNYNKYINLRNKFRKFNMTNEERTRFAEINTEHETKRSKGETEQKEIYRLECEYYNSKVNDIRETDEYKAAKKFLDDHSDLLIELLPEYFSNNYK